MNSTFKGTAILVYLHAANANLSMMMHVTKETAKMVISITKTNARDASNSVNSAHLQPHAPNALKDTILMIVRVNADNVRMVQQSAHFLQL